MMHLLHIFPVLALLFQPGSCTHPNDVQYLRQVESVQQEPVSSVVPRAEASSQDNFWNETIHKAFKGGMAGLVAGAFQVLVFMWLRTIMNYQYARGGDMASTAKLLYQEGGIMRFYRGVSIALIENPLVRFGDTFANSGVMVMLAGVAVHPMLKTVLMSLVAASWRLAVMPLDTCKTVMQVQGSGGIDMLKQKVRDGGVLVLWTGALASFAANWAGSYPWWATYNTLDAAWQEPGDEYNKIVRSGVIGMCASIISDCVSNSFRVVKTYTQSNPDPNAGYGTTVMKISKAEGVSGFLFRGLGTRLLCNVLQGTFFTIVWKCIERHVGQ
jgi:hypothetical protein